MVAPEGRKQWPDVAIAHLTECDSNYSEPSHHVQAEILRNLADIFLLSPVHGSHTQKILYYLRMTLDFRNPICKEFRETGGPKLRDPASRGEFIN